MNVRQKGPGDDPYKFREEPCKKFLGVKKQKGRKEELESRIAE